VQLGPLSGFNHGVLVALLDEQITANTGLMLRSYDYNLQREAEQYREKRDLLNVLLKWATWPERSGT